LLIVVRSFPVAAPVENRDVGESPRGGCVPEPSIRRLAAVKTHDACRNRIPCCCLRLSARTRGTPAPCGPPSTALGPGGHFRIAAARDAGAHWPRRVPVAGRRHDRSSRAPTLARPPCRRSPRS